jgi:E3 ubiquitin-protein ligase HECTD1
LSCFELATSGVIAALLTLAREACAVRDGVVFVVFHKVFNDEATLSSMVSRMVQVLEFLEKLPQYLYDAPGGSAFGLQLLTRRLRFTMLQHNPLSEHQALLLNRSGRVLKTEPLTTVGQLRTFLHRMVSKMWYDHPREGIFYVKELKGKTF